jgi:hypothetical protein
MPNEMTTGKRIRVAVAGSLRPFTQPAHDSTVTGKDSTLASRHSSLVI